MTYLFIDGSNLYASQYELVGPKRFIHFPTLITSLEKNLHIMFDVIYFYGSYSPRPSHPTKEQQIYLNNEYYFYKSVKEEKRTTFFKGYRSKTSGKEKEVDVKLSVDLVGYGLLDKFNKAFLMTGDADFLQACHFLKIHKPSILLTLLCMQNKIMYKGLFYYPSYIIRMDHVSIMNIARRSKYLNLKKTADLCPRLS
ncbi:MAG: NYN domain-containing protein [bacterium]|nr:NYN domain-containing protein [bacterium]